MSSDLNTHGNNGGKRGLMLHKEDKEPTPAVHKEQQVTAQTEQERLEQALGIHQENPTQAVHDQMEHPKANASTYIPPSGKNESNLGKHRANATHTGSITQPGGAYGTYRH